VSPQKNLKNQEIMASIEPIAPKIIAGLLGGKKQAAIARDCGLDTETIRKYMADKSFQDQLKAAIAVSHNAVIARHTELLDHCFDALTELLMSENPAIRLKAIAIILRHYERFNWSEKPEIVVSTSPLAFSEVDFSRMSRAERDKYFESMYTPRAPDPHTEWLQSLSDEELKELYAKTFR
jgi:hypothetical protein